MNIDSVDPALSDATADATRLAVGGIWRTGAARLLGIIADAAAILLIARILGPDRLGVLAAALAITMIVSYLFGFELETQAARSGDLEWCRRAVPGAIAVGTAGAVLGASIAFLIGRFGEEEVGALLRIYLIVIILSPVVNLVSGTLRAAGNSTRAAVFTAAGPVTRLLLLGALAIYADSLTPALVAAAHSASMIVILVIGLLLVGQTLKPAALVPEVSIVRDLIRASPALLLVSGTWLVIERTDVLFLHALTSDAVTGRYVVAWRLSEVLLKLYAAALMMFLPALALIRETGNRRSVYRDSTYVISAMLLPLVLGLCVWGDVGAAFFFGDAYVMHPGLYAILGASVYLHISTGPSGLVLVSARRHLYLAVAATGTAAANVILNLVLIPVWGVFGAAAASIIALGLLNAAQLWRVRAEFSTTAFGARYLPWLLGVTTSILAIHVMGRMFLAESIVVAALATTLSFVVMLFMAWQNPYARSALGSHLPKKGTPLPRI